MAKKPKTKVSSVLKEIRAKKKMTLREAGEATKVDSQTLWTWESGQRFPNFKGILKFCRGMKVSLSKFDCVVIPKQ